MRTMIDVVGRLDELDGTLAIYAAPRWRPGSATVVAPEPADGSQPPEAAGMTFLTSVAAARRAVAARSAWLPGRPPSPAEQCEAIIYYAIYDAFEPSPLGDLLPLSAAG
jgi:hypothetical protein